MALLALGMGLTSCDGWVDNSDNPLPVIPEGSSESGEGSSEAGDKGEVTAITVDLSKIDAKYLDSEKTKLQLTVGDVVTLSFTILPEEAAGTEVELTAADATILSIDGLKVTVLKEGETKVTAKAGDKTVEIPVTVKAAEIPVTGVTLDKTALALTIGDADVQLTATVKPDNATDADVDWESSDLSVATVDGAGIVHAVADGTATITAKAGGKSATCTVTVSKKAASISFAVTAINKTVGDAAFKNAPTIEGDGTVESYSSSDTDVATVATDGTVTIKGAGSTTITVKVANGAKNSYSPNTASYTLTVSKKAASISFAATAINKTIGDAAFKNAPTIEGDGTVESYSSSDTDVATVATDGTVTIKGAGSTTITVKVANGAKNSYSPNTASYTLTVAKKAGSISFATTEISKLVGDAAFTNELTKVGDGTVSYASDNTAVATVATDGTVTIKGAGTANITATVADSDTYSYATTTASYKLTVSQAVDKLDAFGNGGDPLN